MTPPSHRFFEKCDLVDTSTFWVRWTWMASLNTTPTPTNCVNTFYSWQQTSSEYVCRTLTCSELLEHYSESLLLSVELVILALFARVIVHFLSGLVRVACSWLRHRGAERDNRSSMSTVMCRQPVSKRNDAAVERYDSHTFTQITDQQETDSSDEIEVSE